MANILVLGGAGFIGSHVVTELHDFGHAVRVLDRKLPRFQSPCPGVEYMTGDWEDLDTIRIALRDQEVVCHLISTTLPGEANENLVWDLTSNVARSISLFQECVKAGIRRVIFASTGGGIYGIPSVVPIPETHHTYPLSAHGISKLAIEKYLELFHHQYGLEYCILRVANAYGEGQDPNGRQGAVNVFLGKVAHHDPIIIWGDGSVIRDYIYVEDIASAYRVAAESSFTTGLYNIGTGSGVSVNELLGLVAEATGLTPDIQYRPSRHFDTPVNILDVRAVRANLGWEAHTPLSAGLERTWRWVRSLPEIHS